mmetsp:Transcript_85415/g.238397  ORF Transcript_85415/g.238397 Transcript_85415/m.238397 type:complete len:309 (+) Transcript_85415:562-1488(+)
MNPTTIPSQVRAPPGRRVRRARSKAPTTTTPTPRPAKPQRSQTTTLSPLTGRSHRNRRRNRDTRRSAVVPLSQLQARRLPRATAALAPPPATQRGKRSMARWPANSRKKKKPWAATTSVPSGTSSTSSKRPELKAPPPTYRMEDLSTRSPTVSRPRNRSRQRAITLVPPPPRQRRRQCRPKQRRQRKLRARRHPAAPEGSASSLRPRGHWTLASPNVQSVPSARLSTSSTHGRSDGSLWRSRKNRRGRQRRRRLPRRPRQRCLGPSQRRPGGQRRQRWAVGDAQQTPRVSPRTHASEAPASRGPPPPA